MSGGAWIRVHANGAILRTKDGRTVCHPGEFPASHFDREVCSEGCLRTLQKQST